MTRVSSRCDPVTPERPSTLSSGSRWPFNAARNKARLSWPRSVQGGIRHGHHDVSGRIRDGNLLPFASDPDNSLFAAQLVNQAHVADLVSLNHESVDA
jgi:hypothetical protein